MGNVIGIVAEYNPFHNGHARLIEQTRAQLGAACPVVCVMSGDFVQRGSPAVYSKFARAEAAARSGADLVLELPLPWSLSSAEGFARGAVGLLGSLGVVTHLSFGSECGELEPLQRVAQVLLDPLLGEDLRAELRSGIPFAAARQQAVARRVGALAELLQAPNNILAVEYLKAIYDQRLELHPLTGRTHQLRLHCAYLGCPILGDPQYATAVSRALSDALGLTGQQLCAVSLRFAHPMTGKIVEILSNQALGLDFPPRQGV